MKQISFFSSIAISACLLFACTGNSSATSDKDSTSSNSTSSGSGKDLYYEYTVTSTGENMSMTGATKMYISSKGDMRVEMNMSTSYKGNKSAVPIVVIGHSDKPDESITIDDDAKTYTINHFNSDDLNTGEKSQSTATKVGEEKILGFSSVHARIISTRSIGASYTMVDTLDIWRSNDIPVQSSVKKLMDQFESKSGSALYSPEIANQLKQMGCEGFMVKLVISSKNSSTKEELTKLEHKDFPESMFQIPAGYKEDKEGL